jgi:excisionase family DNA binding protein
MTIADTDELLTAQEAADYMGVSLKHIYQSRWLGTGPLSSKRNGRIVFRRSDIDAHWEPQRGADAARRGRVSVSERSLAAPPPGLYRNGRDLYRVRALESQGAGRHNSAL